MIDLGDLARPNRATLPAGNVTLGDGRVLVPNDDQSRRQTAAMRGAGMRSTCVVYHGEERHSLLVIAALEGTRRWGELLHLSMSYSHQNPSWRDIRLVKAAYYGPDRDAMLVLPRAKDYINVHEHCFHLWECPEAWGMW